MANTTKITITLPNEQLKRVRDMVADGGSASISAFVQRAVKKSLQDSDDWDKWLDDALERTGGPLTDKEREWADAILDGKKPKSRARRKVA